MDPDAAIRNAVFDIEDGDAKSANAYLRDVVAWIRRGGFRPSAKSCADLAGVRDQAAASTRKLIDGICGPRRNPTRRNPGKTYVHNGVEIRKTASGRFAVGTYGFSTLKTAKAYIDGRVFGIPGVKRNPRGAPADEHVADDLVLFAENDEYLWHHRRGPFIENLTKKMAKGKYDRNAAVKLWTYYADDVAKVYAKETGESVSPATRKLAAARFRDDFEAQAKTGDFGLPHDWRTVPRHLLSRARR